MELWRWLGDSVAVLLLLVLLYGALLIARRRWLARAGGTFELSVRTGTRFGAGWVLGVGRYVDDALDWYRVFSLWPRPKRRYRRHEIALVSQREPGAEESHALYAGHVVVVCQTSTGEVEFALSPASLTGFQSWLESAPPSDPALSR